MARETSDRVHLDVGGRTFTTTRATLTNGKSAFLTPLPFAHPSARPPVPPVPPSHPLGNLATRQKGRLAIWLVLVHVLVLVLLVLLLLLILVLVLLVLDVQWRFQ